MSAIPSSSNHNSPTIRKPSGITIQTGNSSKGFMQSVVEFSQTKQGKVIVAGTAAVVFGGILLTSYTAYRRKKLGESLDTNVYVRYATQIYNALNPSGYNWLFWSSTANKPVLYYLARQMNQQGIQYAQVASTYNKLYGRTLTVDLQRKLNSQEYDAFVGFLQSGGSTPDPDVIPVNYAIITLQQVALRRTPEFKGFYTGTPLFSNVIGHAAAGKTIGVATGNEVWDNDSTRVWVEIATTASGESGLNRRAWVQKNHIIGMTIEDAAATYGTNEHGHIANGFYLPLYQWLIYDSWQLWGIEDMPMQHVVLPPL